MLEAVRAFCPLTWSLSGVSDGDATPSVGLGPPSAMARSVCAL